MSNITETVAPKARKPRTPRDPNADRAKLEATIERLKATLAKTQEKLAVEANPEIAGKIARFKKVKAQLTANKRILTMKAKKLRRLESEVVQYRKEVADYTEAVKVSQERVDALQPEMDALKITVEDEPEESGDTSEE